MGGWLLETAACLVVAPLAVVALVHLADWLPRLVRGK